MATELIRTTLYSGLCKYCTNLTRVQNYSADTFEQEGILVYRCLAIPDLKFEEIIGTTIDGDSLTLLTADTNISNCNRFIAGAIVTITSVTYDVATTTLTINYTLQGLVGAPDVNFYYVGTSTAIGTVSAAVDGAASLNVVNALPDDSYYLYAVVSTGEMSVIYPFKIVTS